MSSYIISNLVIAINLDVIIRDNITLRKDVIYIRLYVRPRAQWTGLCVKEDDLVFYTEASPKRHQVNQSLLIYLNKLLKAKVEISSGKYSRLKIVKVRGVGMEEVLKRIKKTVKTEC